MTTKNLAPSALNRLVRHSWPGNVRELANTLARAALWSDGPALAERDVEDALLDLPATDSRGDELLGHAITQGVDLPDLMRQLATHYLQGAMTLTGGNKTYSGPHVQDSFPPNLSYRTHVHRSGLALPQLRRSGR